MPGSALAPVATSKVVAQIAPARNREIMAMPSYLVELKVTRTLSNAEDTRAAPFVDGMARCPSNLLRPVAQMPRAVVWDIELARDEAPIVTSSPKANYL